MLCTIWLIVEDETDGEVAQALLKDRDVIVKPLAPTGGTGGLSRLRIQLHRLIQTAKQRRSTQEDCIAVLHDQDMTDPRKEAEQGTTDDSPRAAHATSEGSVREVARGSPRRSAPFLPRGGSCPE